jgi:hypothetical protein
MKWKPPHLNTIDFEIKECLSLFNERVWSLLVKDRDQMVLFDYMVGDIKITKDDMFEGKIVAECNFDDELSSKALASINKVK